jgi:sugar/nucleoside kinase (ribokinase family)
MPKVLVAGDATWNTLIQLDRFPEPRSQTVFSKGFHETVGGTSAGKAFNLRKLGMEVTLQALIGDDLYSQRVRDAIQRSGIQLLAIPDPKGTERHVNLMDASGGRISIYMAYGTFEPALDLATVEALLPSQDFVVLDIINYCRRLIPAVKSADKPIWSDLHDWDGARSYHADFAEAADCLFMSSDALPDYRPVMERLRARGKRLVVCTHGEAGASALTAEGTWIEMPIAPGFDRVDTNGAGDAFFSGVLWAHAQGHAWAPALRIGALVAGLCVASPELAHAELSPARLAAEHRRAYGSELQAPAPAGGGR